MEKIVTIHEGDLRCRTQSKNGDVILTDPSKDHGSKGEAYSPVDMVIVSLSSCILTVMGIVARQHKIDTKGSKIVASYEMAPSRRIGKIYLNVSIAGDVPLDKRALLEKTIKMCPVYNSLHSEIQHEVNVKYTG